MSTFLDDLSLRNIGPYLYDRRKKITCREKMPLWNCLQDTLMFKTYLRNFDTTRTVRDMLLSESIDDSHKYNTYESVQKIPSFIDFYEIDMSAFKRENWSDYKNFNDFFTREIKPEARPIADKEDDSIIVSGSDCRLTVFSSMSNARDLIIKGKNFSLGVLLGDEGKDLFYEFMEGSCINMRLTPQDYHRFHSPIAGKVRKIYSLPGAVYPTEIIGLMSPVDILTENEREIIVVDGNGISMVFIAIGAEGVGRVQTLVKESQQVAKGDELGYFYYGGSDIFVIFNKKIAWDDDLVYYTGNGIETLVQMGEKIGKVGE